MPGDLLSLHEGDRVAADARLTYSADLRTDESSPTGEAHPVHRSFRTADADGDPHSRWLSTMVYAGTTVLAGQGRAVVETTGMRTEFGRIAALTQCICEAPTGLQLEIASVPRRVAVLSVVVGVGFFWSAAPSRG